MSRQKNIIGLWFSIFCGCTAAAAADSGADSITARLAIFQKIYTTGFFGQRCYTLTAPKLWRSLLKKETA